MTETKKVELELTEVEELALRRATTIYAARVMEQTADVNAATPSESTREGAMGLHEKVTAALGGGGMVFACRR